MTLPEQRSTSQKRHLTPGHGSVWTHKMDAAVLALVELGSVELAAQSVKLNRSTLHRWMQVDDFQVKLRVAGRRLLEYSLVNLERCTGLAVACLERNLDCGNPSAEVSAARVILDQCTKSLELLDLEARLSQLEELQAVKGSKR